MCHLVLRDDGIRKISIIVITNVMALEKTTEESGHAEHRQNIETIGERSLTYVVAECFDLSCFTFFWVNEENSKKRIQQKSIKVHEATQKACTRIRRSDEGDLLGKIRVATFYSTSWTAKHGLNVTEQNLCADLWKQQIIYDVKLFNRKNNQRASKLLKQYWMFVALPPHFSFFCFEKEKKTVCTEPHIQSFRNCWEARNRRREKPLLEFNFSSFCSVFSWWIFCIIFKWRVFV